MKLFCFQHAFFILLMLGSVLPSEAETITYRGGKYSGEVLRGLPDGKGTWIMKNGDTYAGNFVAGAPMEGTGMVKELNGGLYTGSILYGIPHGQGELHLLDGSVYVGSFEFGILNGKGTLIFPDGSTYVGAWRDGQYHGQGILTLKSGYIFTGEWNMGKKHGLGKETTVLFSDTAEYQGTFHEDERDGYGIQSWGEWRYIGEWQNGERQGYGTTTFSNGFTYIGTYRSNQRWDQGTLFYPDGSVLVGRFEKGWPWTGEHRDDSAVLGTYAAGIYKKDKQ